ncbi:ATP synthase subunit d, mitochondrial-like [Rhopilema esculentum]|uniref:ATP synthase subunit d, mitochondrial-like n=1 Tax=Rhopilema esculentum TaxID=499914 RepID=UPI0031CE5BA3|eukprot:gene9091-16746_t
MAARKAGQLAVDWIALSTKVPVAARADFNGLRSKFENLRSGLTSIPDKPPTIDWDFFAKTIAKPGLVETFKKQYEALSVPYPKDTESVKIEAHKAEMETEIKREVTEANERVAHLQAELNKLKAEKPFDEMTIDDYLADKPELKAKIDDDIKNHRWYLTGVGK